MDPVVLATVTSGVSLLASEAAKGFGGSAGKEIWSQVKSLLGWDADPAPAELAPRVATRMAEDNALAEQILSLLKQDKLKGTAASALVGNIEAKNVVVAETISGAMNFS